MEPILEQLKRAIRDSGKSRYAISKLCGVQQSALSRLMSGKRSLSMEAAEKVADALGLELVLRAKRKDGRR